MRTLVTGAAGFVGSHLVERLVVDGANVTALDCLTPYYDLRQKRSNLDDLSASGVELLDVDLVSDDLSPHLADVDVVFHQAGQPGVRASWDSFDSYVEHNVIATERLLRAARDADVQRVVYASSSSVYGDAERYPTQESDLPQPKSPYGVTKLAAEHLVALYARNFGLSTVALRYFTVFGPRQRPDMAMHRLIKSAMTGETFPLYGTGEQIRDFTYVGDVVEANLLAASATLEGECVFNVAGGGSVTLFDVIGIVERLTGRPVPIDRQPSQKGDVHRTGGSIERAESALGWRPRVSVEEGLGLQVAWHRRWLGESD